MRIFLSAVLLQLLQPVASMCRADVPLLLNYQAALEMSEATRQDSTVQVSFAIYASSAGGTEIWAETHHLTLVDGRFHVLLGGVTPLAHTLFSSPDRYLGVRIGDDTELVPRQRIVSVAYAIRAVDADDVSGRDITPMSVTINAGRASIDSSGELTAAGVMTAHVVADSVSVGGVGVVDREGRWVGPTAASGLNGSVVDTILTRVFDDTPTYWFHTRWLQASEVNMPFTLPEKRLVEVEFLGSMSAQGGGQTRLAIHKLDGYVVTRRYEGIGNVSGILTDGSNEYRSSHISNKATLSLEAGSYRVVVERLVPGNWCKLHASQTIVRVHRNLAD